MDAHLHRGVDERVQCPLDRRAFVLSAATAAAAGTGRGVVVGLSGVQRENCAQALCVREERLWRRERCVGCIKRDSQECTTLRGNGIEKDGI